MLLCFGIPVFLGQAKINHMNLICLFPEPDKKIVRLDVTMNEVFGVQELDTRDSLIGDH